MAARHGLLVTGGSDYHGSYKPDISICDRARRPRGPLRAIGALKLRGLPKASHELRCNVNIEDLVSQITDVILSRLGAIAQPTAHLHHDECFVKCPDRMHSLIAEGGVRFGLTGAESEAAREVARYIDHTLLKPDATRDEILKVCEEGVRYGFASVCINPIWVREAACALRGSGVKVCTVIGFPLGANTPDTKAYEARRAIFDGASELDMVINVGALKSGRSTTLSSRDIRRGRKLPTRSDLHMQGDHRDRAATDDEKVRRLPDREGSGSRFRQDLDRVQYGRSNCCRRCSDAPSRRRSNGRQGIGWSSRPETSAGDDSTPGATRIGASVGVKIIQEVGGTSPDYSAQANDAAY